MNTDHTPVTDEAEDYCQKCGLPLVPAGCARALERELNRMTEALRIIAGEQQNIDNLMSDKEIARAYLKGLARGQ